MAGNDSAQDKAGERYRVALDHFSADITQATIDGIREDLAKGGTGRLSDSHLRAIDRHIWKEKMMGELFPGNIQFVDFWNQDSGDRLSALASQATMNMIGVGLGLLVPRALKEQLFLSDGKEAALSVGKSPETGCLSQPVE